jgi:hypothetical protein
MPDEAEKKPSARAVDPNKARPIRVQQELWDAFGEAVGKKQSRAAVLVAFMEWYVRKPRARMPQRPEAAHPIESDDSHGTA